MIEPPWPALDQVLAEHLAAQEDALQVHPHDAVELLLRDVEERRGRIDAGAVDDDVDAARALEHGVQQRLQAAPVGGIGGMEPALAAEGGDPGEPRLRILLVAPDEHDLRARAGQALGHRAAQFAGAADDDGHPAFQGKQDVEIILACSMVEEDSPSRFPGKRNGKDLRRSRWRARQDPPDCPRALPAP